MKLIQKFYDVSTQVATHPLQCEKTHQLFLPIVVSMYCSVYGWKKVFGYVTFLFCRVGSIVRGIVRDMQYRTALFEHD